MANETKKGLSTNSNTYTLLYAAVMVIVVAFLLSFVSSVLSETHKKNEQMDKKSEILKAVKIAEDDTDAAYNKYVKKAYLVNEAGDVAQEEGGFEADFNKTAGALPVYECEVDGSTKIVLPLKGAGLWGPIWGYVALESDKSTIYGIFFAHAGETPGLGAEIVTDKFTSLFDGKHINKVGDALLPVAVLKAGKTAAEGQEQVDAISGATLTCNGVNDMIKVSLDQYKNFLTK